NHALAEGRDLVTRARPTCLRHAGVGSFTGTGTLGTGTSRGGSGRGSRAGSGNRNGSTMIGIDSPGSPTTPSLPPTPEQLAIGDLPSHFRTLNEPEIRAARHSAHRVVLRHEAATGWSNHNAVVELRRSVLCRRLG